MLVCNIACVEACTPWYTYEDVQELLELCPPQGLLLQGKAERCGTTKANKHIKFALANNLWKACADKLP